MDFLKILNEGRVEDFQNSYSQKFSKEIEDFIEMFNDGELDVKRIIQ